MHFHSRLCFCNGRLENGGHFVMWWSWWYNDSFRSYSRGGWQHHEWKNYRNSRRNTSEFTLTIISFVSYSSQINIVYNKQLYNHRWRSSMAQVCVTVHGKLKYMNWLSSDANKFAYYTLPATNMKYLESTPGTLVSDILICWTWLGTNHRQLLWL